jgi:hypothetical protein
LPIFTTQGAKGLLLRKKDCILRAVSLRLRKSVDSPTSSAGGGLQTHLVGFLSRSRPEATTHDGRNARRGFAEGKAATAMTPKLSGLELTSILTTCLSAKSFNRCTCSRSRIPMRRFRAKGRQANSDVLCAAGKVRAEPGSAGRPAARDRPLESRRRPPTRPAARQRGGRAGECLRFFLDITSRSTENSRDTFPPASQPPGPGAVTKICLHRLSHSSENVGLIHRGRNWCTDATGLG